MSGVHQSVGAARGTISGKLIAELATGQDSGQLEEVCMSQSPVRAVKFDHHETVFNHRGGPPCHAAIGRTVDGVLSATDETHHVLPGQMLWIPEGTELVYGGYALFGYALYPGNWKDVRS